MTKYNFSYLHVGGTGYEVQNILRNVLRNKVLKKRCLNIVASVVTSGGVTHKYVSVSRGFNRRDFLIPFFTHFLHTEGCHLKGVFTVE